MSRRSTRSCATPCSGMTLDIEHFQKVTLLREMEDCGEGGYAIVADYMASLTAANREYRLRELKMSGRSPWQLELYAKYSGDMPAWAFLELTSFGTPIDFVRFCARRWGRQAPRGLHYDLKREVRPQLRAHGSCLINCFAERGRRPGPASSGVSRRVAAVGIPGRPGGSGWGNTAMQGGRDRARGTPAWPEALRSRATLGARRDVRQGRRRNRGAARQGPTSQLAPRSSSFAG